MGPRDLLSFKWPELDFRMGRRLFFKQIFVFNCWMALLAHSELKMDFVPENFLYLVNFWKLSERFRFKIHWIGHFFIFFCRIYQCRWALRIHSSWRNVLAINNYKIIKSQRVPAVVHSPSFKSKMMFTDWFFCQIPPGTPFRKRNFMKCICWLV